jgi:nitrogen regulatory protein P-II 2
MKVSLIKLTIISESLLREEIITLVRRHGATGFTLSKVEGQGSRGVRASEWEGRNLKFEVIVSSATADAILDEIAEKYFADFAVIAWLTEVEVLRGHKFIAAERP